MGRNVSVDTDDKNKNESIAKQSDSDSTSDLDEEEFIVEKILKMRTTKKGKVLCKSIDSVLFEKKKPIFLKFRSTQMERLFR